MMHARFGTLRVRDACEIRHDRAALDEPGFWVVVGTFEGALTAIRAESVEQAPARLVPFFDPAPADRSGWCSSLDHDAYVSAVEEARRRIAAGTVYQVNVCRVLTRAIDAGFDLDRLTDLLAAANPAPYAARIHAPEVGVDLACASPELFLSREGDRLVSAPIKGTAPTAEQMLPKDVTENVMITDLVRNDLSPVAVPGSVAVDGLCVAEQHPGLAQLVSTVSCTLRADATWASVLPAAFPPGSVSGAPKSTALQTIRELEPVARGPYCGAIGYVDNRDPARPRARLTVGIRTFWAEGEDGRRVLRFGTGAGITWASDPQGEWEETELKARRLVAIAEQAIGRAG